MKKTITVLIMGLVSLAAVNLAQAASSEANETYRAAKRHADEAYKDARAKCNELSGNPKEVCIAQAKAAEARSKADAEAKYKNTPKAYLNARIVGADGDFAVAKERCNAKTGNEKQLCLEEARAAHTKAVVDAKSSKEIGEVKKEAAEEKREADYKVEIEKCDRLGGNAKEACIAAAKSSFRK